jgi:hypothetical protein
VVASGVTTAPRSARAGAECRGGPGVRGEAEWRAWPGAWRAECRARRMPGGRAGRNAGRSGGAAPARCLAGRVPGGSAALRIGSPSGRSRHRSPQPPLGSQSRRVPVPPCHRHDVTLSRLQAAQVHIAPVRDRAGAAAAATAEAAGPHGHSEQAARSSAGTPGTRTDTALRRHPSREPSEPPPTGSGTAGEAVTSLTVSYGRRRRVVPAPCGMV